MRVEANAAQHSQQIEQLKALATNVLRQAIAKPTDDRPREVATPRSARPPVDPFEGKLTSQNAKLLNDVFKLADVSVKFSAPKTDIADFLARKHQELTQLADRLGADQARQASEFASGVDRFTQQFDEDARNIADARATFEADDGNVRDARANNEADAAAVKKFHQNFVQDAANTQAFRENFIDDRQTVGDFNKNFDEDSGNIRDAQANFVADRNNVAEFHRNFVEDRTNIGKFQAAFAEDKTNVTAFRQNYQEDVHNIGRRQQNFVEDKNTMFQFQEQYGSELTEIASFREAYDRGVDSIDRLQKAADLQKSMLNDHAAPKAAQPTNPPNIPSDARAFAAQFDSQEVNASKNGMSLAEITPQRAQRTESNSPIDASVADPSHRTTPFMAASRPFSPQATRQDGSIDSKRLTQTLYNPAATRATAVPLAMNQPIDPSVDATVDSLSLNPSVAAPAIAEQQSSHPTPTSSIAARPPSPIRQQSQYEPDIFQLAGLLAMQMATAAPVQASVNRSDMAAVNSGQAGDLKSGFSFLSHTAKKDHRRKQSDEDEEDQR